jgi:hypothetical protein
MNQNTLRRSTVLAITAIIFGAYGLGALALGASVAIDLFNMLVFALACGTAATYSKDFWIALKKPLFHGHDTLAYGIFVGWTAVALARGVSIIWRAYDKPESWTDSGLWGVHIAGSAVAAPATFSRPTPWEEASRHHNGSNSARSSQLPCSSPRGCSFGARRAGRGDLSTDLARCPRGWRAFRRFRPRRVS